MRLSETSIRRPVFAEGDATYVFKIGADSTVERKAVTLGTRQGGKVEVLTGLAAGDAIVRTGHQKLFPGAKVMVAGAPPAEGAAPGAAATGGKP